MDEEVLGWARRRGGRGGYLPLKLVMRAPWGLAMVERGMSSSGGGSQVVRRDGEVGRGMMERETEGRSGDVVGGGGWKDGSGCGGRRVSYEGLGGRHYE